MKKGCEALNKCEDMINKLALFSANETKEDISTTDLKYILVLFLLLLIIFQLPFSYQLVFFKAEGELIVAVCIAIFRLDLKELSLL